MCSYRQEFSGIIFNNHLYIFFGFNNITSLNVSTIERLNLNKNDMWETLPYVNSSNINLSLSGHGIALKSNNEVLILGGYDGKNYKDSIISINLKNMTCDLLDSKIPNIKKNKFYQFFKHNNFEEIYFNDMFDKIEAELCYINLDSKNIVHYISINSGKIKYEISDSNTYN